MQTLSFISLFLLRSKVKLHKAENILLKYNEDDM